VQSWLLLDLRGNQCVAGLLTFGEQGAPTWLSENTLLPYVSPGDRDARNVADLSFFRISGERRWRPALRAVLDDPALSDAQRIYALFDEPDDRLAELLPTTFHVLIKKTLDQFPVSVLALLDHSRAQASLREFFARIGREARVVSLSGSRSAFAGFALWDISEPAIPEAERQWLCQVELDHQGQGIGRRTDAEPQHQVRCYIWKRSRFAVKILNANSASGSGLPIWQAAPLESVGAAMYALVWQDKLMSMLQVDMESLQRQLVEGEHLLAQLKLMYGRLPKELRRLLARKERNHSE